MTLYMTYRLLNKKNCETYQLRTTFRYIEALHYFM